MPLSRGEFAFLYRSEQGVIDAHRWRRAAAPLVAIFAGLTVVWLLVRPYASRSLGERTLFDPLILATNLYRLLYGLAAILLAICWVNLAAKRFRDRARPAPVGLAGLLPLCALCDGALRWLQPQVADILPRASVFVGDAAVFAALIWTVAECGDLIPKGGR